MPCNCRGTAKPDPQPQIQLQQITPPVIDELPFPDTPDGLLAKELKEWKDEQHRVMMDDINKIQPD